MEPVISLLVSLIQDTVTLFILCLDGLRVMGSQPEVALGIGSGSCTTEKAYSPWGGCWDVRVTSLGLGAWMVPQKLQTGRKWLPVQPPRPPVTLWRGKDGQESNTSDWYLQHFFSPWLGHLPRLLWPGRGTRWQKTLHDIHIHKL